MSGTQNVIVLTPNGRRQTVKVNLNTTILQILEQVCEKHHFQPEKYEIRHHNKCLDTGATFRFSGLPNNAQLELCEATTIRVDGTVTLELQLEDGTRKRHTFVPNTSIWDVVIQVCPQEAQHDNVVIIYMRQEMYGKSKLESTTLRSLGLTNGRALFRLIHRSPEELHTQANISAPLPVKPVEEKPYVRTLKKVETNEQHNNDTPVRQESLKPSDRTNQHYEGIEPNQGCKKKDTNFLNLIKQEKSKASDSSKRNQSVTNDNKRSEVRPVSTEDDFLFLDKRKAMVFSKKTAQTLPCQDLPEDFFDLTINDAKVLYKDLKKRALELENRPLQTSKLREFEKSKEQLNRLNRYKAAVIRVYFPDQNVLQATFGATDSVSVVIEFVREYLENKKMDFYLYTTPPKDILNNESKLFEIGCVPNSILYFGMDCLPKDDKYLRSDLISKFTTPSVASLAANQIREAATRFTSSNNQDDDSSYDGSDVNAGASTSTGPQYEDYPSRLPTTKGSEPVPKWFKMA